MLASAASAAGAQATPPAAPGPNPPASRAAARPKNSRIALVVLGLMAFMGVATAVFVAGTRKERRENDSGLKQSRSGKRPHQLELPDVPGVPLLPPLEMEVVKRLPSDLDVLLGVQVAAMMQDVEGHRLLNREVPGLRGSVEGRILGRLKEATGIAPAEIDQIAVGGRIEDQTVVVAVRTLGKYDPGAVIDRLGAEPVSSRRGESVHRFRHELAPSLTRGLLHCVNERILLLAWEGKPSDVSGEPGGGPREELAALLAERVRPHGPVWVAGHVDPKFAPAATLLLAAAGVPEADRKALMGVRSFALWMNLADRQPAVWSVARARDARAADELEKFLRAKVGDRGAKVIRDEENREFVSVQYR